MGVGAGRNGDLFVTNAMTPAELEAALRQIGAERYHSLHPFHHLLHAGRLKKGQVQAWALNRYAYQSMIPRKDAALLSNLPTRALRREWRGRMLDHDGIGEDEGGIERWLRLTSALGLNRDYVTSLQGILPGTKFAVEAYWHFVRNKPILEGIASSLTEMFAPKIHAERISGMLENYDFVDESMVGYFRERLLQAPRGVRLQHDKTRDIWVVQAPERRFELDDIAVEIVKRVDGKSTISVIVDDLTKTFDADRQIICTDVINMLQDLCDKGVLDT